MITKKTNQSQAVMTYLRSRRKAKLTASEITDGVNKTFRRKYTPVQISKCLNKFKNQRLVTPVDKDGTSPNGISCYRWSLHSGK